MRHRTRFPGSWNWRQTPLDFFQLNRIGKFLDKQRVASITGLTPMARFGEPEELIGATLLLVSEKAGRPIRKEDADLLRRLGEDLGAPFPA